MINPTPNVGELFQKEEQKGQWLANKIWTDWFRALRATLVNKPFELATFTVAGLPSSPAPRSGSIAYASDGRKVGEGAGAGTGVTAYFSGGNWRRPSDDTIVAA